MYLVPLNSFNTHVLFQESNVRLIVIGQSSYHHIKVNKVVTKYNVSSIMS